MARRAFVAGGTRGIGRAVGDALEARGFSIVRGSRAHADVAVEPEAAVERAAEELGGLDALVWSAVEPVRASILDVTPEQLDRSWEVNARAFVLGARRAAELMEDGGRIVGFSATGGHRIRNEQYAPLGLAKGVVEAAVRFLAVALAPRGITVNAVAPGPTETEAFDAMNENADQLRVMLAQRTPLARLGTPEDAAHITAWLCSEEAGWVTGQVLFSDGGYTIA